MWHFGRVEVRFGKPMDFSRFEGLAGNRFIERAVIDEVMYELMQLSGQEYVDLYAADLEAAGRTGQRPGRGHREGRCRSASPRAAASAGRAPGAVARAAGTRAGHDDHRERPPQVGTTGQPTPQRGRRLLVFGHQGDRRPHRQRQTGQADQRSAPRAVPARPSTTATTTVGSAHTQ